MIIEKNQHGYIIRTTHRRRGQFYYFSGMKAGKPVFLSDFLYAKAYTTEKAARKKAKQITL